MALLNDFVVCHIRNLFHVVTKYTLMLEISTCCIGIGWFIWGWFIFSLHAVAHKEIIRDRHTIKEVFEEFCESGRTDRAYRTIQKQDSLWRNHLCERFGKRFCDDVSSAEVIDYLSELYFVEGFSYQYTQSFLKMFYLIFGQAYSRNYLDVDAYNKLCVNKDTKIRMPKMKTEDDTDIVSFSHEELALLDEYFKGTNAETAYLLGRHCGLRINETFGLKWCNVDLENGTITIDRQMQYQEGIIKLVAPKTRNSRRTIYMSDVLCNHLTARAKMLEAEAQKLAAIREQKQRFIDDMWGLKPPTAFTTAQLIFRTG